MKVLHYSLGFPPVRRGGMTAYCMDLMDAQAMAGDDVALVWPGSLKSKSPRCSIKRRPNYTLSSGQQCKSFSIENPLPVPLVDGVADPSWHFQQKEQSVFNRFYEDAGFDRLPDLILMDGGKGQVNVAEKVLEELGLSVPVAGMVKDDRHRTRGLYYNNEEIPVQTDSEGFHLLTRIQDETHRFAIEYHRMLRGKEQVHSVLDDIPGIGKNRRKELMRNYPNLEAIRKADVNELAALPSMNRRAAESVLDYLNKS